MARAAWHGLGLRAAGTEQEQEQEGSTAESTQPEVTLSHVRVVLKGLSSAAPPPPLL